MRRRRPILPVLALPILALPILALLAACGTPPPREPQVTLPPTARQDGVADPTRSAILSTAYVFGQPSSVAGDPAAAAEALGRLEYLTAQLATDQRFIEFDPTVQIQFQRARAEARAAFGLDPAAAPQRAMDSLFGTAAALRAGDAAGAATALAALTGPARAEGTLQHLAALPYLPEAATATARAQAELGRRDRGSRFPFR